MAAASAPAFYDQTFAIIPSVPKMTELGRALFFDRVLSASGALSCSSCHDPQHAYGPPGNRAIQSGGARNKVPGLRAVPSLRYLQTVPPFAEHRFDEAVDESVDQGPSGGHAWDGRADTAHDQAKLPLLSPREMGNRSDAEVVARLRNAGYGARFHDVFGEDVLDDDARGFGALLLVLEVFQQSPRDFYPYSSRYDAYLRGQPVLTVQELRGLRLFNDPAKGNCAECHPSQVRHGVFPQFTDFGYAALAVPRNKDIAANRNPAYNDLGLCGPERKDLRSHAEYCGMFRVPTLRNVALRPAFFHNGRMHTLEESIRFYVQRDPMPERWYPVRNGVRAEFDDVPAKFQRNVEREAPFGRKRSDPPALTDGEIDDIAAFLRTLTDADLAQTGAQGGAQSQRNRH